MCHLAVWEECLPYGQRKTPLDELTPKGWTLLGYDIRDWVLYCTGLSPFSFSLMR